MTIAIETPRLRLRQFQAADLPTFAAYRSDPETARYQYWETPYTLEQAEQFLERMTHVTPGTPGEWLQLALTLRDGGEMVGDCAFCVPADDTRQAELGYTLAPAHRGRGYATEGARALLGYLFVTYQLHRVFSRCDAENTPSARVLERIGMRREAHFVENSWFKGRWGSEFTYAILRREWQAQADAGRPSPG